MATEVTVFGLQDRLSTKSLVSDSNVCR
jgi:hypothetical protein